VDNGNRLANNTASSLMVGFNSTIPTLFVGPSGGIGTTGHVGIGTAAPGSKQHVVPSTAAAVQLDPFGAAAGNTGEIRFLELAVNGINYVGFKAPNSIGIANPIWTLPSADGGVNDVLTTNGAGVLSWAPVAGGGGLWTDNGTYIYPGNVGTTFQISDTGNLIVPGNTTLGDATTDTVTVNGAATTSKINRVVVVDGVNYTTSLSAINALPSQGGKVFVPEGTYNIAQTITFPYANITVEGAGAGTILNSQGVTIFLVRQDFITIRDMQMVGNDQYGVMVDVGNRLVVNNCVFIGCSRGIFANTRSNMRAHTYEANYFFKCGTAIYVADAGGGFFLDVSVIANNTIYATSVGPGIYVNAYRYSTINGNTMMEVTGNVSILLADNTFNLIVTGNCVSQNTNIIQLGGTANIVDANN
jgi:hypothetical protein